MASTLPQFHPNSFEPLSITNTNLLTTLNDLRSAIRRGVDLINTNYPPPDPDTSDPSAFGMIFDGHLGVALMFLRLENQATYIRDSSEILPGPDFRRLASARIPRNLPKLSFQHGRLSPLNSPSLGATTLRILSAGSVSLPGSIHPSTEHRTEEVVAIREAIEAAMRHEPAVTRNGHSMGIDEVLAGRAGLLAALVDLQRHVVDNEMRRALQPVFEAIPKLADVIVEAGVKGAENYVKVHGERDAMPLMWPWIDNYYGLGGMHGMTGILTALIHAVSLPNTADPTHIPLLTKTITALSALCISNGGHLPLSTPPYPSKSVKTSPLVQLCHGSPGMLLLLSAAMSNPAISSHSTETWHQAFRLASEKVWKEGLVSKGGGLCHGITGNAWPWLLLSSQRTSGELSWPRGEGDDFLTLALPFLLEARSTQPFASPSSDQAESRYRRPDHPYSLFEGLAGTICAWAEACVVIEAHLRMVELELELELEEDKDREDVRNDEALRRHLECLMGMPGFGL